MRRAAAAGTEAGVRRALDRLALHGLVITEEIGDRVVYLLNRDHVLYPAATALLGAADELPRGLSREISAWQIPPVAAALYGSAARRDGDAASDIDILLVSPASLRSRERELWKVHRLRGLVQRWTGNRCQVTDRTVAAVRRLSRAREPIVDEWRKDALSLAGADISQLLGQA